MNKVIAIVAAAVLACVLSKLSCHAQTPLQAFREYRTNWQAGPILEHQDGTNLVKTQAFQVLEITTVLHSQGSRVIRDAPTLLSVTNSLSKLNVRPPPAVKPTNQLSRGEIMRRERELRRQALETNQWLHLKK